MIKIEHTVTASPEQMEFIIEGMRNPLNSWDKSDSGYECLNKSMGVCAADCDVNDINDTCEEGWLEYRVGDNDHKLMQKLARAGTDHRKYMRMMPVYVRITAPVYWLAELDTYKIGTVRNSCSFMHKGVSAPFSIRDFSLKDERIYNELDGFERYDISGDITLPYHWDLALLKTCQTWADTLDELNALRERYLETKDFTIFQQIRCALPQGYLQTSNFLFNYEVLANIYKSRKKHRLDEWREFCKWIETLDYSELITVDWKEED